LHYKIKDDRAKVTAFEVGIVDLHYDNTVHSGRTKDDRTAYFDL